MSTCDVLIVGAGLSGLMAANGLHHNGYHVKVVDKGRGVGGRMATRRIGPGRADHGAQFFTVRNPWFQEYVEEWEELGLVFEWSRGWSDGSVSRARRGDGHPRYAVFDGFTAVAKALAEGLDVETGVQIVSVSAEGDGWLATDANGNTYQSRGLVLTPPVPQSLALLEAGDVTLHDDDRAVLEAIQYDPCVCGLFWVEGDVVLPEPGALQRPNHPIAWIADNQRKGISPEARIVTVHANPELSQALWEEDEDVALSAIGEGLAPFLSAEATIREGQLKRWRYAAPAEVYPDRTLQATGMPMLFFAGDAFGGPRIEGAALSGLSAGFELTQIL